MSFVQTGFLIACAAVAIPVLVHLLSRWQVRQIELGTMRFLREVIHDGAQRRKIRRWLLLMTRMALLALLALLFARPFLPERTRRDGDRLRVVLIDRSASMGMPGKGGRLIDDAVGAAADSVAELGSDAIVLWAWFDRDVEPLPEGTSRPSAPRAVVGDTNYLAALSWARDRINAYSDAIADVVLVTDLQQTGLVADPIATETLGFPDDVPVRIIDVGRPAANNLAVTSVTTPTTRLETKQDVVLAVTLFNYGTLPFEEVPLTAAAQDGSRTVRQKKSINIPGGQAEEISFNFGSLDPGTWQFAVGMDINDDLAADNRRFTAVEVAKPIQVLVLDSGSREQGVAAESYFLATALEQTGRYEQAIDPEDSESNHRSRFHADVVYLADEASRVLDVNENPLVVVADAGAISHTTIDQLETYVRQGGKALVFAGDGEGSDSAQLWQQAGLAPGEIKRPQRSGAMPFRIVSVNAEGEMLEPFEDPQHGDLSRLSFHTLLPVSVADSTDVLAWFDHGRPAMTQHYVDKGRVVWFLSSADASWGSWTTSPLYLPLVQQMAADLMNLTGEGPIRFRSIGDDQLPERRSTSSPASINTVALTTGGQDTGTLPNFSQLGFQKREDTLYVVNGTSKESDPTRLELASFVEHFGLTPADAANAVVSTSVVSEKQNELWPWFAAAVFVLLIAEFSLANRTSA
jgi:PAS domain-containing protein